MKLTVIYDACVLYPETLRSSLMYLALTETFHARWTDAIHEEWIGNLLEKRIDLTLEKLTAVRGLMDKAVPDALVFGYEEIIETLELPDKDDRHVLAAAIHSKANLIVTHNTRDFPSKVLMTYDVEAVTPDLFISNLLSSSPDEVVTALQIQRSTLKNPAMTVDEYLNTLLRQGLRLTVEMLKKYRDDL